MTIPPSGSGTHVPLRTAAAWAVLERATVSATGPDAIRFVDNFVTAALAPVAIGGGTEGFFADGRGWVLALTTILRTEAGLEIVADAGAGPQLRDHLEHYHIREAVELVDASAGIATLLVAGPLAAATLEAALPGNAPLPAACFAHVAARFAGHDLRLVRVTGQGADGFWIRGSQAAGATVAAALTAAGVPRAEPAALEAARIESGFPRAADVPEKTLPQELGRDARAISFTKGCYLGQETVARLDALGHVNRQLAVLAIETNAAPVCPAAIHLDGTPVGTLTSSCLSPRSGTAVGLALLPIRALAGQPLAVAGAAARVVAVPPAGIPP